LRYFVAFADLNRTVGEEGVGVLHSVVVLHLAELHGSHRVECFRVLSLVGRLEGKVVLRWAEYVEFKRLHEGKLFLEVHSMMSRVGDHFSLGCLPHRVESVLRTDWGHV